MKEVTLDTTLRVKPLEYVTSTRLPALEECALRGAWQGNKVSPLLPSAPAARLGSAIHRLLQEAGMGRFAPGDKATIEKRLQEHIGSVEQEMRRNWLERHLASLENSVPGYQVRFIQARNRALEVADAAPCDPVRVVKQPGTLGTTKYGFELYVSTPDGKVRGRIDAVLPSADGPVIRDYKSGAVLSSDSGGISVKETLRTQLRLYAALYAVSRGLWPARLEIVPASGPAITVSFERASCLELLKRTQATLEMINDTITTSKDSTRSQQGALAKPSPANCGYCTYRPACHPYKARVGEAQPVSGWPNDVWGRIESIRKLGNGKLLLALHASGRRLRVRGVTPGVKRHPALENLGNDDAVAIFNLRSAKSGETMSESALTIIYRYELPDPAPK